MVVRAVVCALVLLATTSAMADERYDIATFRVGEDWKRQDAGAALQLTQIEGQQFCQINVFKSAPAKGDLQAEYTSVWNTTATTWKFSGSASSVVRPAIKGWRSKAGRGSFVADGVTVQSTVNVYSNGTTSASILTIGTSASCDASLTKFFASLSLDAPATTTPAPATAAVTTGEWSASVQPDWVLVTKGNVRVYLYFVVPYDASQFSGTGVVNRDWYWTTYVGKQFAITSTQYRDGGETIGSLKPTYVEGQATDRSTRERRFVGMNLSIGTNAAMLAVASAPDEATFRAAFPTPADLAAMSRFNRFPIGSADDLTGTWQDGASQTMQWYDAQTGAPAGMTFAAHSSTFTFAKNGTYTSVHNGASGAAIGPMSRFQQNYKGTYKVESWRVTATNRFQGKTAVFDAHLQAVRGGWLLALDDGRGSAFVLVRTSR